MISGCVGAQLSGFLSLVGSPTQAEEEAAAWLRLGLALLPMGRVGIGVHKTSWSIFFSPEEPPVFLNPPPTPGTPPAGELRGRRAPSAPCLQTSVPSLPGLPLSIHHWRPPPPTCPCPKADVIPWSPCGKQSCKQSYCQEMLQLLWPRSHLPTLCLSFPSQPDSCQLL